MARRDEGEHSLCIFDRGATKPDGLFHENPPGGGSFACGLRWLGRHIPLRGCSGLAALSTAKIPCRSTQPNFQTGSKQGEPWETRSGKYLFWSLDLSYSFGRFIGSI